MRLAYADPPYPGQAKRHYGKNGDPFTAPAEVDHAELIALLSGSGIRIGVWHVTNAAPFPPQRVMWTWEAVIVRGGRWRRRGQEAFVRDVLVAPNLAGWLGGRIIGAKPPQFCRWVFDLLGLEPDDELIDLYPGSGAVTHEWRRQPTLFSTLDNAATLDNSA